MKHWTSVSLNLWKSGLDTYARCVKWVRIWKVSVHESKYEGQPIIYFAQGCQLSKAGLQFRSFEQFCSKYATYWHMCKCYVTYLLVCCEQIWPTTRMDMINAHCSHPYTLQTWDTIHISYVTICRMGKKSEMVEFSKKAWRHSPGFPGNRDILGLGLPSDNNFQPITSFVSLALLWQRDSGRCNLAWIRPETRDLSSSRIYWIVWDCLTFWLILYIHGNRHCLGWNRLWVRFLAVSDKSHVHWANDYLCPFGVLWVHNYGLTQKLCLKKNGNSSSPA